MANFLRYYSGPFLVVSKVGAKDASQQRRRQGALINDI